MRVTLTFPCAGETLAASLDRAEGEVGVLIVSGGNEIRMGAHRGMALLAQQLVAAGIPCFRYDRRGIGDSTGEPTDLDDRATDLIAAASTFRLEMPEVKRVVAFGNCDAATAIALFHAQAKVDRVILSNPWVAANGGDDLPPAAAIRARYMHRLRQPAEWRRLLFGGVDLLKLYIGLRHLYARPRQRAGLASQMAEALRRSGVPTTILLAAKDNTAIAFQDAWARIQAPSARLRVLQSESHSYAAPGDKDWLLEQIIEAVR